MFQIKCSSGYELQVAGSGAGDCKVVSENGYTQFSGTYIQCVNWCKLRAIHVDVKAGNVTSKPMSEYPK